MFKNKFLRNVLFASLAMLIIVPFYDILIAYPSFIDTLTEDAKDESVRIATLLTSMLNLKNEKMNKESLLSQQDTIQSMKKDLNLQKIKAFSPSGENLYSTDPDDIKNIEEKREFYEIIAKGNIYVIFKQAGMKSLEDHVVTTDVVETYIPVMDSDTFLGAFEIYYDITSRKVRLNKLRSEATVLVLASAFGLFVLVLITSYMASKNISERERIEAELRTQSLSDELTGLNNRRGFLSLSEQQLKLANRDKKRMFLMASDLDTLKQKNDRFGHKVGDMALISIANILKNTFRDSDIAARIGGDEFVVFGIETPDTNIETLTKRLGNNLNDHNSKEEEPLKKLSLSYGYASYDPEHPCSIEELLTKADKLMYEQKRNKQKS